MTYIKKTFVSCGDVENHSTFRMRGHVKPDNVATRAVNLGRAFPIRVEHSVFDTSGKGRSGHDGCWEISTPDATPVKISNGR